MPSLEHLVQHYMNFSDGLPINLRYAVPPKPKPPLPIFRNIIPNDPMPNNNNPIVATTLVSPKKKQSESRKAQTLGRKSKSGTNPFINMLSLRKSKLKEKKTADTSPPAEESVETIAKNLKDLKFTSDLVPVLSLAETMYNIPSNNSAIVTATIENGNQDYSIDNNKNEPPNHSANKCTTDDIIYFTQSDNNAELKDRDKDVEEIYFIDAPSIAKIDMPSVSTFNYVPFCDVPFYPDGSDIQANNNNNNSITSRQNHASGSGAPIQLERLQSTVSLTSTASERFFNQFNVDSPSPNSTTITDPLLNANNKMNYFIPEENLIKQDVLGGGEFGNVYSGSLKMDNGHLMPVAIKTLRDEHCQQNRGDFLREASVMIKLSHRCIIRLIGISKVLIIIISILGDGIFKNVYFNC